MNHEPIGPGLGEGLPGGPRPSRPVGGPARSPYQLTEDTPVYVISVAAELSGLHPQTLRQYDRLGLVCPDRTAGRGGATPRGTSSSCARSSASRRTRASTWPASSASSNWRTRSRPSSPASPSSPTPSKAPPPPSSSARPPSTPPTAGTWSPTSRSSSPAPWSSGARSGRAEQARPPVPSSRGVPAA